MTQYLGRLKALLPSCLELSYPTWAIATATSHNHCAEVLAAAGAEHRQHILFFFLRSLRITTQQL